MRIFHVLVALGGWAGAVGLWGYGLRIHSAADKPLGGTESTILWLVVGAGFLLTLILAVPSTFAAVGARRTGWGWAIWVVLLRDVLLTAGLAVATARNLLPGEDGAGPEIQAAAIFGTLGAVFLLGTVLDVIRIFAGRAARLEKRPQIE